MKALTLFQPWASLVAHGVKTIETRSWRPPRSLYRQRIAIHAGKQVASPNSLNSPTRRAVIELYGEDWPERIPTGVIVATVLLANSAQVNRRDGQYVNFVGSPATSQLVADPYGDFGPGRWLWFLQHIQPVEPPIPAIGHQGLWEWDSERLGDK